MQFTPSYILLAQSGELEKRLEKIGALTRKCRLCPRNCGVDRRKTKDGKCRSGLKPIVSSFSPHFGEEPPLVGRYGSGTIFFTNCNLECIFCQNCDISQMGCGEEVSCRDLAGMMITLQNLGCHNINFVSPTHMVHAIVKSLIMAVDAGLQVPLVYNTGGYDSLDTLRLLDGIFDIYMPDLKYSDAETGLSLSGVQEYPERAGQAVTEMHRQVGDLKVTESGIAQRGLLVRHLVLPENLAGTDEVIKFISGLSKNTYLNIMDQYRPVHNADRHPGLQRRVTAQEYEGALDLARHMGLTRGKRF